MALVTSNFLTLEAAKKVLLRTAALYTSVHSTRLNYEGVSGPKSSRQNINAFNEKKIKRKIDYIKDVFRSSFYQRTIYEPRGAREMKERIRCYWGTVHKMLE